MAKPRVLCLHGRGLNSAYFRAQLKGLIRKNPELDFFFLEGHLPAEVAPEALGAWSVALKPQERRAWQYFTLQRDPPGADPAKCWKAGCDVSEGLKHTWQAAMDEAISGGPFFATLGFSQGANVAAALLAKQACSARTLGLRCSVNLCGGMWGFWSESSGPRLPVCVPSLHILGRKDPLLEESRCLVEGYAAEQRVVLEHEGGHTPFPLQCEMREEFIGKVGKFLATHAT
ncbi:unnamed protein product [Effrenium voratum]|nr:unnamed protein product [Effrenium voratum]